MEISILRHFLGLIDNAMVSDVSSSVRERRSICYVMVSFYIFINCFVTVLVSSVQVSMISDVFSAVTIRFSTGYGRQTHSPCGDDLEH